ncbi:hypothetical protein EG328_004465, partial [Venturia inaequalis]
NVPSQLQGQQPIPQLVQNNYEGGLPYNLYNPPLAVRLGNLAKLYIEDMKYGGEEFKSLKGKSIIFEDIATKVGITQMQDIVSAFPQVLKDKARDFYYEEIIDRKYTTINKLYQAFWHYFETLERR